MQLPPTPGMQMAAKKGGAKKARLKVRDLPPRKEPKGGGGMNRNDPPLPIPPPGFIINSDEQKRTEQR